MGSPLAEPGERLAQLLAEQWADNQETCRPQASWPGTATVEAAPTVVDP
jgi:hypothetical protein